MKNISGTAAEGSRPYYEAYDDRYRQVHREQLQWFSSAPSPIVSEVIRKFGILPDSPVLELGCGEGRDAVPLLQAGYSLLATDISSEAIAYCRELAPRYADCFSVLDCIHGHLEGTFHFIYAVAVLHMLVEEDDRDGFYRFLRDHLREDGIGLICTMGDGTMERRSDTACAFTLQERTHGLTGKTLNIAGTSCRMVTFPTLHQELARNGLVSIAEGLTSIEPDFSGIPVMYTVVRKSTYTIF